MNTKKLKIPGITGFPPLFLTRLTGIRDAKCGSAAFCEGKWTGAYIDTKIAIYSAFVALVYLNLELATAALYQESAQLMVEYQNLLRAEARPSKGPSGKTSSIQARNAASNVAQATRNLARKREIEKRIPEIDESISHLLNVAHEESIQARELTIRRLGAYLGGASLAVHKPIIIEKQPQAITKWLAAVWLSLRLKFVVLLPQRRYCGSDRWEPWTCPSFGYTALSYPSSARHRGWSRRLPPLSGCPAQSR